jgi:hypothetical protein
MTGSVTRVASTQLVEFVLSLPRANEQNEEELTADGFVEAIDALANSGETEERITMPILEVVAAAVDAGLGSALSEDAIRHLVTLANRRSTKSRDVRRLHACVQM